MDDTNTPPAVELQRRGAVAWLYLNRPGVLNALDPACLRALTAALRELAADPAVRVLVLSGRGRAFCAGMDIGAFPRPGAGPASGGELFELGLQLERTLTGLRKPVIAALNGLTVGGGLELTLMCDFAVACASARIGDGHANFGLIPGGGASVRLPRAVGAYWARYLMYSGEVLGAAELAAAGLLVRVFPDESFERQVQALAEGIAAKSPLGLARMKDLVAQGLALPEQEALARERALFARHLESADAREGRRAFAAKQRPEFTGR